MTILARRFLAALALLTPLQALAVDPNASPEGGAPSGEIRTLTDYLGDLTSDDGPKRVYAARTVRFETRRALRALEHAPADSLAALDAQSALVEIEARAASGCESALRFTNTAVLCAEILADLGRNDELPAIRAARSLVTGAGPLRRFDKAVATLEALPPLTPASPAAPAPSPLPAAPTP